MQLRQIKIAERDIGFQKRFTLMCNGVFPVQHVVKGFHGHVVKGFHGHVVKGFHGHLCHSIYVILNCIDEKSKVARVDEKDNDDRTPLHYAV